MEYSNNQSGGEAAAEAGTDPNETTEKDQSQRHQGQEELAPPQIWTKTKHGLVKWNSKSVVWVVNTGIQSTGYTEMVKNIVQFDTCQMFPFRKQKKI